MSTYREEYVGQTKMIRRVGTHHVYPINDDTKEAACQLNWAHEALSRPNVTFDNGKELHEIANETIEKFDDVLIDHLRITA
jgi:hypothetical protein